MTSHLLDGLEDPRLAELSARALLRHDSERRRYIQVGDLWWIEIPDRMQRVPPPSQIEALLEVLGERRAAVCGLSILGAERELAAYFKWEGLSHFKRLELSSNLGKPGLEALLESGRIAQLEHLGLEACDIGKGGILALKRSDHMPALRSLDLSVGDYDRTRWSDTLLKLLVSETKKNPLGATLRGLEALKLGGWDCDYGLSPIADSELGRGLKVLDLEGQMRLGAYAGELLLALARNGGRLEELRLGLVFRNLLFGADNWNAGITKKQPAPPSSTLRRLILDGAGFRAEHIAALPKAWFWPQLEQLSLAECNLYPGTLKPLASASAGLRWLSLADNHLGRDDLHELATYPLASTLEFLDLRKTARPEDIEGLPGGILKAIEAAGGLE